MRERNEGIKREGEEAGEKNDLETIEMDKNVNMNI